MSFNLSEVDYLKEQNFCVTLKSMKYRDSELSKSVVNYKPDTI